MANEMKIYAVSEEALSMVLTRSSGGSGDGPGLEARVAKIEVCVDHIQIDVKEIRDEVREIRQAHDRDFRILFGVIMTTTLGLAALMAKGFHWI